MGTQLKQRPHVKAAIDALGQKKLDEVSVSPEYVLRKLVRTVEKAEQQENHGATLRGLELLAKHLGMFVERQEISGPDGGAIVHEQKVKQNAADFVSKLAKIAANGGTAEVVELPNRRGEGGA
jgi:phage terminase small subunit